MSQKNTQIILNIESNSNNEPDQGHGTTTLVKPDNKVKKPSMYKVILLNDDFTPMDFVTEVLKRFFRKSETESTKIMLQVHNQGAGIAGIFSYEIAETKVYQVNNYAKQNSYPLKCILEKEGE